MTGVSLFTLAQKSLRPQCIPISGPPSSRWLPADHPLNKGEDTGSLEGNYEAGKNVEAGGFSRGHVCLCQSIGKTRTFGIGDIS